MPLIIKKRRTKEELQQLEEAKRAAKKTKAAEEREAYKRLPQPPMIGRNALIMEPKGPKDYSGERFRTLFRQRLLESGEMGKEYSSWEYGKKYGTRDWNEATKMAKAHIKKYNSKASVARLRAEFLERILRERTRLEYGATGRRGQSQGRPRAPYPAPPKSWENVPTPISPTFDFKKTPPSMFKRKTKSDS